MSIKLTSPPLSASQMARKLGVSAKQAAALAKIAKSGVEAKKVAAGKPVEVKNPPAKVIKKVASRERSARE